MGVTIDLSDRQMAQLQELTAAGDPVDAVTLAVQEFLRRELLKQLKSASGNVEFDLDWQALEAMEIAELPE